MRRYFPLENENARLPYNIQEAKIVGQVAKVVPRIYVALEDHQSTMVEVALEEISTQNGHPKMN